ncbi:cytosolic phospholipase A2 gamma-like [Garra rufa]|uniref:cytosolic phospholipase A2 gamma-like n=1 Tax=Garra rufa TaxID=137080 RepID=UPI003CCE7E8D
MAAPAPDPHWKDHQRWRLRLQNLLSWLWRLSVNSKLLRCPKPATKAECESVDLVPTNECIQTPGKVKLNHHCSICLCLCCSGKVRIGHSLNKEEEEYVAKRRNTVFQCLHKLNICCSQDKVPNIALIGSGGGQRAMVGLLASLVELDKAGLLGCMLYLSGVSGSTWCMASLYKEPDWSTKLETVKDKIIKRISGPNVSWTDALAKLSKYHQERDHFSLTDVWAVMYVTSIVKEIDEHTLTDQWKQHSKDPYPIYTVTDKNCKLHEEGDPWFEISPHEAGYSLTGAFVDTCNFGSQFNKGFKEKHQNEFDMLYLQAMCGSALADKEVVCEQIRDYLLKTVKPGVMMYELFRTGAELRERRRCAKKRLKLTQRQSRVVLGGHNVSVPSIRERGLPFSWPYLTLRLRILENTEAVTVPPVTEAGAGGGWGGGHYGDHTLQMRSNDEEVSGATSHRETLYSAPKIRTIEQMPRWPILTRMWPAMQIMHTQFHWHFLKKSEVLGSQQRPLMSDIRHNFEVNDREGTSAIHYIQYLHVEKIFQLVVDLVDMKLAEIKGTDPSAYAESIKKTLTDILGRQNQQWLVASKLQFDKAMNNVTQITKEVCNIIHSEEKLKFWITDILLHSIICLNEWIWGTKYNFLHNMTADAIPATLLESKMRDYEDAGLLLNSPYFSVLRKERNIDLIISLDFSEGDPFMTVTEAAKKCTKLNIPFPEVNIPSEEKDKPKDFYVFKGQNAPTVIHIPLLNVVNCGDNLEAQKDKYGTLQLPYSPEKITDLMEVAGKNIANNIEKLKEQIRACGQHESLSEAATALKLHDVRKHTCFCSELNSTRTRDGNPRGTVHKTRKRKDDITSDDNKRATTSSAGIN